MMSVSPSGQFIATFCENGFVFVYSSEFEELVFQSSEAAAELACQLVWLGDVSKSGARFSLLCRGPQYST